MRRIVRLAGIAATTCGLALSAGAQALDPYDTAPESRAYLNLDFGGKQGARDLHFGLQLDANAVHFEDGSSPAPMLQLDFTRRGLNATRVNGLNVLRSRLRVNQDEEEGAAVEEEEGFFSGIGSWFGGLFGGDDEEAEAETAEAEPAAEGDGGYTGVDWGLVAVGAVGLGFVIAEVMDGEDDPEPAGPGSGPPAEECPLPLPPLCDVLPLAVPVLSSGPAQAADARWLDAGTGQMGDLIAAE